MGVQSSYEPDYALNGPFVDALYQIYLKNPDGVDVQWRLFFESLNQPEQTSSLEKLEDPPPLQEGRADVHLINQAHHIIDYYRSHGHRHARLDPLEHVIPPSLPSWPCEASHNLLSADDIHIAARGQIPWPLTLSQMKDWLEARYCQSIGYEIHHIADTILRDWWITQIEQTDSSIDDPLRAFESVAQATLFEQTLHVKFPAVKRFGLEGGEGLMASLHQIRAYAHQQRMDHLILGMAHRGRLNVLAHVLNKPYDHIFSELKGLAHLNDPEWWSGDVKYHMGYASIHHDQDHALHVTMLHNPSHLESVNPVVLGLTRALQDHHTQALPLLIHGDASFAGQGIVLETLQMRGLPGYNTGGTLHIVINNQVGFTADPHDCRSGPYCTDMARAPDIPILHVNGDDVDAIMHATRLALTFRTTFHKDVVIDIVCYRRHGHNEMDEPLFTQPSMYHTIAEHPTVLDLYRQKLNACPDIQPTDLQIIEQRVSTALQQGFEKSATHQHAPIHTHAEHTPWHSIPYDLPLDAPDTGVNLDVLQTLGQKACVWPEGFHVNAKIQRQYEARQRMLAGEEPTDWAVGEMLAWASLLGEGHHIRLSGQDSQRGTFSHRHAVLHDQTSKKIYTPLQSLETSGTFQVWNSLLSEFGVMGFEFGYSLANPHSLTIWEAQFGDFANGAQVMLDQYLSSSQSKWGIISGLTLLLPHGFEGQGPEHSSARLERFLQMGDRDNWYVVNCTTPANFFHVLRRQLVQVSRRPLIVMSPKSLLRHKSAVSDLADYGPGQTFRKLLHDPASQVQPEQVQKVVLCSGKLYYDLEDVRQKQQRFDVALVRCEQLHPFPESEIVDLWARYPQARWFWCQEEPQNMGAWRFIENHWYETPAPSVPSLCYVGRAPASSPATGLMSHHQEEQRQILDHIFHQDPL